MDVPVVKTLLDWLLLQDPLYVLVLILLVRSEARTSEVLSSLRLLNGLHLTGDEDPKKTLS